MESAASLALTLS